MARDLRTEFYEFMPVVIQTIAGILLLQYRCDDMNLELLDPQDLQLAEASFVCLGFLFKFLLKQLLDDITNVFKYVVVVGFIWPLLIHSVIMYRCYNISENFFDISLLRVLLIYYANLNQRN